MTISNLTVARFAATLARELPKKHPEQVAELALELIRRGRRTLRFAEAFCSRPVTQAEERRDQTNDRRIEELVTALGPGWGVMLSGDPRGCTVKLKVPSGFTDDFAKTGVCVPGA